MKITRSFLCFTLASVMAGNLSAEPLKKAAVTQIINQVGIIQPGQGERSAIVNDVVEGKLGVRTGQKSRAELVFADSTLTRLGANTVFNFEDGSRNMDLNQGTILLQVPKNAGGATIRTAAVTAAVTGTTILFEHTPAPVVPDDLKKSEANRHRKPHGYIKAMVLEGHLKVWLKGKMGESIIIGPGQMLIMADDATEIPEVVDFDIQTVMETSKLVDNSIWISHRRNLDLGLIDIEIAEQRKRKTLGDLIETNLFINGRGTTVVMADSTDEREHVRDSTIPKTVVQVTSLLTPTPTPDVSPKPTPTPSPTPPIPRENDLAAFKFAGSTDIFGNDAMAQIDPTLPGNARLVSALPDASGGTTVLPTFGNTFGVLSTGGTAPNGKPYTATLGTSTLQLTPTQMASGGRSFVEFDYRFLTNEINKGTGNNDRAVFVLSGANGMSVTYELTRNQLQTGGTTFTPIARQNVGGFLAGTDWLTLKLEVTPFIQAGNSTFTIAVYDWQSSDGDSALTVDRYQITQESLVAPNSDLVGLYSAKFPSGVTFGENTGEYRPPGMRGRENVATFGPGSDGGSFFAQTSTGDLIVNTPIMADTGPNKPSATDPVSGGAGGSVSLFAATASVQVNSRVQVASDDASSRRISASGGAISVTSYRSGGNGVVISNSGELLSLLNAAAPGPGGRIDIQTVGSNILVNGGLVVASRGVVTLQASGASNRITLNNATIMADTVRIGAIGSNGQLVINGGKFSADTTMKLYGGSTNGSITFTGNTQLGGNATQKVLSANTVTVQNGVQVQVAGVLPAQVFTSIPNYTGSGGNSSTTGTFTGAGATTFGPTGTPGPPPF